MGKLYNKMMVIEYLLGGSSSTINNQELKAPKEIKSTKDFWEVKHVADNPKFQISKNNTSLDNSSGSSASAAGSAGINSRNRDVSNFPYSCETSCLEMNGQYKFVFGLESKAIVSEQALREVNAKLFPKNKGTSNEVISGSLHPCYDAAKEKLLICPVTNKPFGRPILLYPSSPIEMKRAEEFSVKKKSKKRKESSSDGVSAEVSAKKKK